MDGQAVPPNKPTALHNGAQVVFGGCPITLVLRCDAAGDRKAGGGGAAAAGGAGAASGLQKVRASHLLVKHRESRRPSSWKVRTHACMHAL